MRNEADRDADVTSIVRSEEELAVGTRPVPVGDLRARKVVDHERVEQLVPRGVEQADVERVGPNEVDSGEIETLPDGSVSIPVLEERLVVEKRLVVRERVIVRKQTSIEEHLVEADLRRERVDIEADAEVRDRVHGDVA